jgi:predicted SnoaL-like aldol condensation-catalyzing enzyme
MAPDRSPRSEELAVHRPAFLGAILAVCLVTAAAMIAAALLLQPAPIPAAATTTGRSAVVERFYDAANEVIATGDRAALDAVVAPDFVARDPLPGAGPGRDGLADYLVTLHRIDPSLRLTPERMVADGDLAVARVTVSSERDPVSLGGVVSQSVPWGRVDVFRIAGEAIVERWSETDGATLVRPLAEGLLEFPVPSSRVVTVERIVLAPGAAWQDRAGGPDALYLEDGTLRVAMSTSFVDGNANARDHRDIDTTPAVSLAVGQSLAVPPDSGFLVTNNGPRAAKLVVVDFAVPAVAGGDAPPAEFPLGVTGRTLAGDVAVEVPIGAAALSIGEVDLAPAAQLSLSAADGPILAAVDAGQLDVRSSDSAWLRSGADGSSRAAHAAILTAGDGALLPPGSFTLLGNAGDDTVSALIVTLRPAPGATP